MNDAYYMDAALLLAQKAFDAGEVPVGAVVVRQSDGRIIGEGRNSREIDRSPISHAEIIAIEKASRFMGGWRLSGCTLYVTLEPCPMCAGAIINSRIDRVVFGAYDPKSGSCGSKTDIFSLGFNHRPLCEGGVMRERCSALLTNFFKGKRENNMNNVKLIISDTADRQRRTASIAYDIWHEYFPVLLSNEQIDYMLEKFCSFEAMQKNIAEGYIYYIISRNGCDIGYTAIKPEKDNTLFLSKIYIYKDHRGKGFSRSVIEFHKQFCKNNGLNAIRLTVNKYNLDSIAIYEKLGFKRTGEGVADIGGGFVMDDYYYQLDL